ncbi:MAG: hypothetical protein R3B70_20990 [Polyangiaceae bacterium]
MVRTPDLAPLAAWARTAASIGACLWLAAAVSCGDPTPLHSSQDLPMVTQDDLQLDTTVTADSAHLSIRYRIKNTGPATAYLLNRAHRTDSTGAPQIDKDFAYVYVTAQGVTVEKAIPEIPAGLAPTEPVAPHVTPVRPGDTFEETVSLPLPLTDSRPYRGRPPGSERIEVDTVRFVLGYMRGPEGTTERSMAVGSETVVLFQVPKGTLPSAGKIEVSPTILSSATGAGTTIAAVLPAPEDAPSP